MSQRAFVRYAARSSRRRLHDALPSSSSVSSSSSSSSSVAAVAVAAAAAAVGLQLLTASRREGNRHNDDVPCPVRSASAVLLPLKTALCEAEPATKRDAAAAKGTPLSPSTSGARPGPNGSDRIPPLPYAPPYPSPPTGFRQQQQQQQQQQHRPPRAGMKDDEAGDFHGLFPRRQLWQPRVPYPLWDRNWDGRDGDDYGGGGGGFVPSTGNSYSKEADRERARFVRKHGVTRHIILVRHGQYDEDEKVGS
jgi:hypothetical protein